jgi:lipoyl(octanoyl) transferase
MSTSDAPLPALLPPEWRVSDALVPYRAAVAAMESRVEAIAEGRARELVWLLEHPPLYTGGTSAQEGELLDPLRFEVHRTGRGGRYTYHGPGQRIAYVLLDLKRRGSDVRAFVDGLERWIVAALASFNLRGEQRPGRIGVWVERRDRGTEEKIAAIGVRVRKWVSFHGISLNVEPDLSHYAGIVPCGISEHGVTSLVDLGLPVTMDEADHALKASFAEVFGPLVDAAPPV